MNRTRTGKWMAVLCSIALAGCASDAWSDKSTDNSGYRAPDRSSSTGSSGSNSGGSATSGSTAPASMAGGSGGGSGLATSGTGSTAMASYGVVQAIDQMQRQDVGVGSGAIGAAAASGTAGATGASGAPVYRVSVRMDDGSSQMIVVDAMPPYKVGDRVRYSDGALTAY